MTAVLRKRLAIFIPGSLYAAYDRTYARRPITTAGATTGSKALVADVISQKCANTACEMDYVRNLKFGAFCCLYAGSFQHVLFNAIYPKLFPGEGLSVAIRMTVFDGLVNTPFLYIPSYFAFKAWADGSTAKDAFDEYRSEGPGVIMRCWAFWTPATFILFRAVPTNFRILYVAVVGYFWEIVLSYCAPMVSKDDEKASCASSQNMEIKSKLLRETNP